jgi:hypothetical protein
MKSSDVSPTRTTANGATSSGAGRPKISVRNVADPTLSCAATIVWLSWIPIVANLVDYDECSVASDAATDTLDR